MQFVVLCISIIIIIVKVLDENGTDDVVVELVKECFKDEQLCFPFQELDTEHSQNNYYRDHLGMVVSFLKEIIDHDSIIYLIGASGASSWL